MITSAANARVKWLRQLLEQRRFRQEERLFVVEGTKGVRAWLEAKPGAVQQVYAAERQEATWREEVARTGGALLADGLFERVSALQQSEGVLAVVAMPDLDAAPAAEAGGYLLCDQITDPGNLGTLIRSAVGAGVAGVLLAGDGVDPFNPKTVRASMGTLSRVALHRVGEDGVAALRAKGWVLLAMDTGGVESLFTYRPPACWVLAVGSESHGLSPSVRGMADAVLSIPLAPGCESLNAAVAGSLALFTLRAAAAR